MTDEPGVIDDEAGPAGDEQDQPQVEHSEHEVATGGGSASGDRSATHARSVLEYLVKSVVDDPDGVRVELSEGRRHDISLDVRVSDGDMGRVIGKRGRVAQSIRTVVRAAAVRDDITVDIEFLE